MDDIQCAFGTAFENSPERPPISLRAGNALDSYQAPPPFDEELDRITSAYLEENHWGIAHLDSTSWRYYLPILMDYALHNLRNSSSMAVDALLASLRPPDREPSRLAVLSPEQERAVVGFLDTLAFQEDSAWKDLAMIALEEYWAPGAAYRDADGA